MTFLLNLLWVILGGFVMALGWWLAGLLMALTIIGLPWTRAAFTLGFYTLWPFGREMVDRRLLSGREDMGTGVWGLIGNIVWFLLGGGGLAVGHCLCAAACALTIVGIPFAWVHLKLAMASIAPIGKDVVDLPPRW